MKIEWDLKEFEDFADKLRSFGSAFSPDIQYLQQIARLIAKELHERLIEITPVKTGVLADGWRTVENYAYMVKPYAYGFKVTLRNRVPYAASVNDGHYSYNQYNVGQPTGYVVKNRTPKIYTVSGANQDETYVYGHFFVEKAVVQTCESNKLEAIIMKELQKWWESA